MDTSTIVMICCGAIFAGCLIWLLIRKISLNTTTELMTSDDDPTLKLISEQRQTIIQQLINCICMCWLVSPDELTAKVDSVGFNKNVITITYSDFVYRFYCFWESKFFMVEYNFVPTANENKSFSRKVKLKTIRGVPYYAGFDATLMKWKNEYLANIYNTDDERFMGCIRNGIKIANSDLSDEQYIQMLLNTWNNIEIDKQNADVNIRNLTRLTAFLCHFYPQEFNNFIDGIQHKHNEEEAE